MKPQYLNIGTDKNTPGNPGESLLTYGNASVTIKRVR